MKYLLIVGIVFLSFSSVKGQIDFGRQLEEIPPVLSDYIDYYFSDITTHQSITYLNSLNCSGDVLDAFQLRLSFNTGFTVVHPQTTFPFQLPENFELLGSAGGGLYGSGGGELYFRFIDEVTGGPIYHPFTGETLGFAIPLVSGFGTGIGVSPALVPNITLGIGFGTELSGSILPGVLNYAARQMDFNYISNDLMYVIGVRHNLLHWFEGLREHDFYLNLGATYNAIELCLEVPEGTRLLGDNLPANDYFQIEDNFQGINYQTSGLGFELFLGKSFSIFDLSLFASVNRTMYSIESIGDIGITINSPFQIGTGNDPLTIVLDQLLDISHSNTVQMYGAAAQLKMGRLNVGIKVGVRPDENLQSRIEYKQLPAYTYLSTTLGYRLF